MSSARQDGAEVNTTPAEWRQELEALPSLEQLGGAIPAVFLAHGSPSLITPKRLADARGSSISAIQGIDGPLAHFLKDLGPALVEKYKPKALVALSAHFETPGGGITTDYGDENPLLFDYFGFPDELYKVEFKSRGDKQVAERVVQLLYEAGIRSARLTNKLEARGEDGRGFAGPGLDHGVFVPFIHMFNGTAPIPIVQVSIPSDLRPATQHAFGAALAPLRKEGVLVVAGGLTVHTFRDFSAFSPELAKPHFREWEKSIVDAVAVPEVTRSIALTSDFVQPEARRKALFSLVHHPAFRAAHPREEHFIPLYVAAGAASEGGEAKGARMVCGLWGAKTVIFGV
ncbi:hypothetical protein Rhopal_005353-T1 [Rhodotorula paludigena]|uniref:Extradiol ring-cleavage dioxygenase class III enzyme subunit B domain-containing protein n=1 Tax=Rhodotorula paludigena TaxID=86838 RepID=A0AAV5GQ74_9BASI|nr:hypothetical protein Rhopal_005353-T1 [Rhodotorula paludigena]